jgi:hypothetical protein
MSQITGTGTATSTNGFSPETPGFSGFASRRMELKAAFKVKIFLAGDGLN